MFLGDLVAKGPSSREVIRLAMDIGALSVRGNHDHEVVREGVAFHTKTGKYRSPHSRQISNGSTDRREHLRIALSLSPREFRWLCELPYYIKSVDLGTLFVHAGFQPGVRCVSQFTRASSFEWLAITA